MAHITKRDNGKWRAEICIDRKRQAKTFPTKREALAWANEVEQSGIVTRKTFRDLLEAYEVKAQSHKGYTSERSRLGSIRANARFLDTLLTNITPEMISGYKSERLKSVAPVSVRREMIIMSSAFGYGVTELAWISSNPISMVKKPPTSKPRMRGISQQEIELICAELDKRPGGVQTKPVFLLSIETGMRLSEILGIRWSDVSEKTVTLKDTKNSDTRKVPLSPAARQIIESRRGLDKDRLFTSTRDSISQCFLRSADAAGCPDVHFHDARSEALTRLSKKLDVLQLAKMIGHRDTRSLMIYYAEKEEDIADRL